MLQSKLFVIADWDCSWSPLHWPLLTLPIGRFSVLQLYSCSSALIRLSTCASGLKRNNNMELWQKMNRYLGDWDSVWSVAGGCGWRWRPGGWRRCSLSPAPRSAQTPGWRWWPTPWTPTPADRRTGSSSRCLHTELWTMYLVRAF